MQAQRAGHQRPDGAVAGGHDDAGGVAHQVVEHRVRGPRGHVGLPAVHVAVVVPADVVVAGLVGHQIVGGDHGGVAAALLEDGVPGDGRVVGHAVGLAGVGEVHRHQHAAGALVVGLELDGILALVQRLADEFAVLRHAAIGRQRAGDVLHAQGQQVVEHAAVLADQLLRVVDGEGLLHVHVPGDQVAAVQRVVLAAGVVLVDDALSGVADDVVHAAAGEVAKHAIILPDEHLRLVPKLHLRAVFVDGIQRLRYDRAAALQRHGGLGLELGGIEGVFVGQLVAGDVGARREHEAVRSGVVEVHQRRDGIVRRP